MGIARCGLRRCGHRGTAQIMAKKTKLSCPGVCFIEKLQDPQLVVAFQKFCGIQEVSLETVRQRGGENTSNGYANGREGGVDYGQYNHVTSLYGDGDVSGDTPVRRWGQEGENNRYAQQNVTGHHESEGTVFHNTGSSNNIGAQKNGLCTSLYSEEKGHNNKYYAKKTIVGYRITNYFWHYIFTFGANLGNEIFFITFLPFMGWNYDSYVLRRACAFWALYMYLGQATKDILKIPRPPSPPVMQLEAKYALEYGLPSTHAMVGAGLPFSIYFLSVNRYQFPWQIGLTICVVWCSLVCLSRIYLGMHSFLDVIAGLAYVFALMPLFFMYCDTFDEFALHHWLGPYVSILLPLTMCLCYPTLDKWSTARGDTTLILAVGAGVYSACYFNVLYGYMTPSPVDPPYPFPFEVADLWHHFLRFFIGVVVLGLTREILKNLSYGIVCWILQVKKKSLKEQQRLSVELPYKFITYSVIGFNALFTVPIIHSYLGIARAAFRFEA